MDISFIYLAAAYLIGSIPFGLILTKMAGTVDIRTIGSGNIGATNVLRTGNKSLAALTLFLDIGKGAAVVVALRMLELPELAAAAGAMACVGHCFPVFLKFQGGKGVATFMGTILAISMIVGGVAALAWILIAATFRMSSLASLTASLAAPIAAWILISPMTALWLGGVSLLIFVRHRENISRIISGTESKIGQKAVETDNS